jgi:hypothetical protein
LVEFFWCYGSVVVRTANTEQELLKLWKGLFYCMWMSDKPLVQDDLARSTFARLVALLNPLHFQNAMDANYLLLAFFSSENFVTNQKLRAFFLCGLLFFLPQSSLGLCTASKKMLQLWPSSQHSTKLWIGNGKGLTGYALTSSTTWSPSSLTRGWCEHRYEIQR